MPTTPTTDALAALASGTQQEDWWEAPGAGVAPDWFSLNAGLEATARRIRCFEPQLIDGLVQTRDYARVVIGADPRLGNEVVEQRVQLLPAVQDDDDGAIHHDDETRTSRAVVIVTVAAWSSR